MAAARKSGSAKAGKLNKAAGKASKASKTSKASKAAAKKAAAKKGSVKKAASKKAARKASKFPSKKAASKKMAARKSAKKPAAKKTIAKKSAKKAPAKKNTARKNAVKKTAAKKPAARRTPASPATAGKKPATPPARLRTPAAARKTSQSRRKGKAAHTPVALAKRLATRTPVGWKDNLVRLRGYSAMELKELRRHYEPRSLVIRAAEPDDAAAISELLLHAFGRNAEDQRADALRRNGGMICELAADYRGAIVGYIGFARVAAAIDGRPVEALAILPLAVESAFRELGIARRLVAAGLAEARASGADAVFVRGEASFFGKFGFSAKVAKRFMDQASEPILSVIEFSPGTLAGKTGSVAFPVSSGP